MRRIAGLSIFFFACALGLAHAAPARLPYYMADAPKMPARVMVDLNGTAWLGKYLTVNRIFIFEADGTLSYKSPVATAKPFKNRGSWKLEGNKLYFEHFITPTKKLMEFRGAVTDGNTIVGEATFPAKGAKEAQTLQRTTPP